MIVLNEKAEEFQKKLSEYKLEEERRLMSFLSEKYNIPTINPIKLKVRPEILQFVKEVDARMAHMAVYSKKDKILEIAVNSPTDEKLKEILQDLNEKGYSYNLNLATNKLLGFIWEYYNDVISTSASTPGTLSITNEVLDEKLNKTEGLSEVKELLQSLETLSRSKRISKNIEYIIYSAITVKSSDIHLEPTNAGGLIRFRVDGILVDIIEMNENDFKQLITRIKLLSGMKITQKGAQDGAFVVRIPNHVISIRASSIPKNNTGSMTLRILDPRTIIHNMDILGIHPVILNIFKKHVKKPNGMILTTGPTGSGKTTTLYSFLNYIKSEDIKIITLEDPIEYILEGIVQTQVTKTYTFANGLRMILRQDPDVILLGEIRDESVAQTAIQAALTGHLVFSTLHTNDALGALPRLAQLSVDSKSFSRAINIIIAQRLVRKLCSECSEKHKLTDKQKTQIEKMISELPESYKTETFDLNNIRKPSNMSNNCSKCINGYKGRVGIFEVFEVNDEIETAQRNGENISVLKEVVKKQNLPFMKDDGVWKMLKGITSIDEINRSLGTEI